MLLFSSVMSSHVINSQNKSYLYIMNVKKRNHYNYYIFKIKFKKNIYIPPPGHTAVLSEILLDWLYLKYFNNIVVRGTYLIVIIYSIQIMTISNNILSAHPFVITKRNYYNFYYTYCIYCTR